MGRELDHRLHGGDALQEIHRHRRVLEQLEQQSGSFLLGHAIVLLQQRGLTVRLCTREGSCIGNGVEIPTFCLGSTD